MWCSRGRLLTKNYIRVACAPVGWVFWGDQERVGEVGRLVWGKLAAAYIERQLKGFQQAEEAEAAEGFQAAAAAANDFEDQAAAAGYVALPSTSQDLRCSSAGC